MEYKKGSQAETLSWQNKREKIKQARLKKENEKEITREEKK